MKKGFEKYWWALLVFLFLLGISIPSLFPVFLFLGIIVFALSPPGKKILNPDAWDEENISIERDIGKPQKSHLKDSKKPSLEKKEEKNNFTLSSDFLQKTMNSNTPNMPEKFPSSLLFVGVLVLIVGSVIADGIVSIPAGNTGVVFDKLSNEVKEETLPSGISFKIPFFQQVTVINTRMQEYTINSKREPIEALTKDGQKVNVDVTVQYFINRENAPRLFEEQGMDYESKIIKAGVRSIVREAVTGYDSIKLYDQEFRKKAQDEMKEKLKENYEAKYIHLEDLLIRDVKFSGNYLQAIEDEQVAKVNIKKAENQTKQALELKKKKIIEAEAEAESIRLKGEALSASPEVIQLQFVEKMAPSINWGILPDGAVPLIDPKSLQK